MKKHKLENSNEKISIPKLTYYRYSSNNMNTEKFLEDILIPLLKEAGLKCVESGTFSRFFVEGIRLEVYCRNEHSESYRIQNDLGLPYSKYSTKEKENQYYIRGEKEIKKKTIVNNVLRLVNQQKEHNNEIAINNFIRSFLKDGEEKVFIATKELFGQEAHVNAYKSQDIEKGFIEIYPFGYYTATVLTFFLDGSIKSLTLHEKMYSKNKIKKFVMNTITWLTKIDEIGKRIHDIYAEQVESFAPENEKVREEIYKYLKGNK